MSQTVLAPERAPVFDGGAECRRILFVCTGNTCRSPMAAALLNHLSRPKEICSAMAEQGRPVYHASSAGLYAPEGAPISANAALALERAGVVPVPGEDYTAHRARTVTAEMVALADEVVGLTGAHAMELLMRFPEAASKIRTLPADISDPFGGDLACYEACLAQLKRCLEQTYFAGGVQ